MPTEASLGKSVTSILQDQSGNFPTSPAWARTKHWDLLLPRQAGGDARDFALPGSVASNPARGRPNSLGEELICHGFVTAARYLCGCIFSCVTQVTHMEKLCSHLWTANVELQAHMLISHWNHRESQGRWANEAFVVNG